MIKKFFSSLFLTFLLIGGLYFWWQEVKKPVNLQSQEKIIVVVAPNATLDEIGKDLLEKKLIKNLPAFKLMVMRLRISKKIEAGDYRLSPKMNLYEICTTLTHGTLDVWVTVPEGLRREEIGEIIKTNFAKHNASFDTKAFLAQSKDLEGYLFPDTYLLAKDASMSSIIKTFTNNFEKKFKTITLPKNLTEDELVILSSLVEREVKGEKDRKIVAGIIIKRWQNDWFLQIDASTQYAKAGKLCDGLTLSKCESWWPKVTSKDLQNINSPYNTYLYQGLPPTPICNPGLVSLQAVASPQKTDYWYYLSDSKGITHYAKTYDEHEGNIKKYLD